MSSEFWLTRAANLGVSESVIAAELGMTPKSLADGLRARWRDRAPQPLVALVLALESLTPAERAGWLSRRAQPPPSPHL